MAVQRNRMRAGARAAVSSILLGGCLLGGIACGSDSDSDDETELRCDSSTATSGDLCQVNFFCDEGDGPAAYCSDDGTCRCGPAVDNPKEVAIPGVCDMELEEASRAVNDKCDFGL